MKKHVLFLAAATMAMASYAQTSHTVSNNPANPAQFTEIQEAINAANDGDTIYVAGSATNYGNVLVNKRVVLIGAGWIQDGANSRSEISQLDITATTNNEGGSGSVISGFLITADVDGDPDEVISDVIIERCLFNRTEVINISLRNNENWIFRNNIVYQDQFNATHNFLCGTAINLRIENNIFQGETANGQNSSLFQVVSSSAIVTNNVFYDYVLEFDNSTVANNIFIQQNFTDRGRTSENATFNNNIFFGENNPSGATNTLNNNIFDNPGFESADTDFYNYPADDITLASASPGKNAGTDGTDIGVFGGNFPMVFEPANPEITQLLINTVQLPVGGELEFTVQATGRQ